MQRVARAGVVDAVARIVGDQPVVAGIVEAAKRQGRPQFAAFGRVVVDDVEDQLEARRVQAADGDAQLVERAIRQIARLRREEADAVIAPVVAQALLQQGAVLHEGMDRQQLDRRDAEPVQVVDEDRIAESSEGAALVGPQVLAHHAEAADMGLVDHGVGPGNRGRPVVGPVEASSATTAFSTPGALSRRSNDKSARAELTR